MSNFKEHELIPIDNLKNGIDICFRTAGTLNYDAQLLCDEKRYRTCIILSLYAIEESNKCLILLLSYIKSKPILKQDWKNMTQHTKKNTQFIKNYRNMLKKYDINEVLEKLRQLNPSLVKDVDNFSPNDALDMENREKIFLMFNKLKKFCLYTDWDGEKSWFNIEKYSDDEIKILAMYVATISNIFIKVLSAFDNSSHTQIQTDPHMKIFPAQIAYLKSKHIDDALILKLLNKLKKYDSVV